MPDQTPSHKTSEVRFYNSEDARRDQLVEMFIAQVAEHNGRETATSYRVDIEYMAEAVKAFADECGRLKMQQIAASEECEACGHGDLETPWNTDALVKFVKAVRELGDA